MQVHSSQKSLTQPVGLSLNPSLKKSPGVEK